jgi:hypothetical protein
MSTPNPKIADELRHAKEELARLKAEKIKLFPPNPHPLAEPDHYPHDYTPEQINQRNALVAQIESLESRIEELQERLYQR